jgi:two-component system, chemotaxis family, response regulator Rcp1
MKKIEILLVEDNPGDIRLTKEALKESKIENNLHVAIDGVEAIDFLQKRGRFVNSPTPDLILLDLNLPRKGGIEVLAEIKSNGHLKVIPIVVLTTSQSEKDILKSYELHVNCFVTKPVEFDEFMTAIRSIEDFWFTIVKLPKVEQD